LDCDNGRWDNAGHRLYPKLLEIRSGGTPPRTGEIVNLFTMGTARVTAVGVFQSWAEWVDFPLKGAGGAGLFSASNPDPAKHGHVGPLISEEVITIAGCKPQDFEAGRVWFCAVEFVVKV
jgi:hypothetical protein